jgi:hypothetical protein
LKPENENKNSYQDHVRTNKLASRVYRVSGISDPEDIELGPCEVCGILITPYTKGSRITCTSSDKKTMYHGQCYVHRNSKACYICGRNITVYTNEHTTKHTQKNCHKECLHVNPRIQIAPD